ncbi:hypothetical protein HNQ40_000646 [Algisphaera agarilytica]|uniref:Uncharacterized protein n=1 Tax=Algisphaera agarilytica TaxID=1385975 RepID=A0A7X0H406_9BACT|nr:hypothetical protein [Algisphaera agarilytica]
MRASIAYALAWGVVALVLRAMSDGVVGLWWGGLGLIVVWLAGAWWSRSAVPSADKARALFDHENELGGLMMVEAEGRESWSGQMSRLREPSVRWRGGPSAWCLVASVCFVIAAMLVPMPGQAAERGRLDVSRSVEAIQRQVEVLEEEHILDSPDADQIRQAAERIGEEARGDDPSKTWEALDHLADKIEQAADEAVELAQQRKDEAAAAQALSEALEQGAQTLSSERLSEAMSALAELSESAAGLPTLEGLTLPPELAEALSQSGIDASQLSEEMLQQLAEMMAGRQEELQAMLDALAEAGLCEGGGSGSGGAEAMDAAELLEWLSGDGECDGQGVLAMCRGMRAGRGGLSRGPGHAEMIWKDPASKEGVEFDPNLLPPSRMNELRDAQLLGTSRGAPQQVDGATGSSGGALAGATAGGGSAAEVVVLPRHRAAVQRYFERGAETDD